MICDPVWRQSLEHGEVVEKTRIGNYEMFLMNISSFIGLIYYQYRMFFFSLDTKEPILALNLEISDTRRERCFLGAHTSEGHITYGIADPDMTIEEFRSWAFNAAEKYLNISLSKYIGPTNNVMSENEDRDAGFSGIGKRIEKLKDDISTYPIAPQDQEVGSSNQPDEEHITEEYTTRIPESKSNQRTNFTFVIWAIIVLVLIISIATIITTHIIPGDRPVVPQGPAQAPVNVDKQVDFLRGVVNEDPQNVQAWTKLGNILMDSQRYPEAVEAYGKVLELEPGNVNVRVDAGTCYRRMGRPDLAAEYFRKAIELDPSHPYAHRNLGIVLAFDLGNVKAGREEFEKYLELSPAAPDRAEMEKLITELKQSE